MKTEREASLFIDTKSKIVASQSMKSTTDKVASPEKFKNLIEKLACGVNQNRRISKPIVQTKNCFKSKPIDEIETVKYASLVINLKPNHMLANGLIQTRENASQGT